MVFLRLPWYHAYSISFLVVILHTKRGCFKYHLPRAFWSLLPFTSKVHVFSDLTMSALYVHIITNHTHIHMLYLWKPDMMVHAEIFSMKLSVTCISQENTKYHVLIDFDCNNIKSGYYFTPYHVGSLIIFVSFLHSNIFICYECLLVVNNSIHFSILTHFL